MDKMSVSSILLVSFPETVLTIVSALIIAGYKDVLNFKEKKNIIKLFTASSIITLCSAFGRQVFNSITINLFFTINIYLLVICFVYRHKIAATICGVLVSSIPVLLGEAIFVGIFLKVANILISHVYANNILRILLSIPVRTCQILVIIFICKLRNIDLRSIKFNINESIQIILFILMILSSLLNIESSFLSITRDYQAILKLIINLIITMSFSGWLVYSIIKIRQKSEISKKLNKFELKRIKKLLEEGCAEHVINLINIKLDEGGKP